MTAINQSKGEEAIEVGNDRGNQSRITMRYWQKNLLLRGALELFSGRRHTPTVFLVRLHSSKETTNYLRTAQEMHIRWRFSSGGQKAHLAASA